MSETEGTTPAPESATNTRQQCEVRSWCEVPRKTHDGEHTGEADLPKITATAYREDFAGLENGMAVPEVIALLNEREHSHTFDRFSVQLSIVRPDELHSHCHLTMKEAELLARALLQLMDMSTERSA